MMWARYLPVSGRPGPEAAPVAALSRRDAWIVTACFSVLLVLMLPVLGVGFWKYQHLGALEDYRAGYAVGDHWRDLKVSRDCYAITAQAYGHSWPGRADGWGEYQAGCLDGQAGREAASWYNLRSHLWANSD